MTMSVVTFGEIMLRLTTPGRQRFAQATAFEITFGGAEANVAVMIAQLGGSAEFVTRLPDNELGDRAVDELLRAGVRTNHVVRGGERLGVYFLEQGAGHRPGKVLYDRAHSSIAEADVGEFDWERILAEARWFHWSGITPALSETAASVVKEACKVARRRRVPVSFDMNYRAKLWTVERAGEVLQPLMEHVNVCFCGSAEARAVLGAGGDGEEALAADLRQRYGFEQVVMTHRHALDADRCTWRSSLWSGAGAFTSREYEVGIVDRIGAGDSFTGALIFALLRADAPQAAIEFATAASALAHTIPGDFPLMRLEEVEALVAGARGGRVQR